MIEESLENWNLAPAIKEKLDAELRYRQIAEWLHPNSSVLDLGARYGYGYEYLLAKNISVIAVDLNRETLTQAPSHPKVTIINSTIEKFVQEEIQKHNSWDAAILAEVIEHFPMGKWQEFLNDIFQITSTIVITTPYKEDQLAYLQGNKEKQMNQSDPDIHKVFNITPEIFEMLGFRIVRSKVIKYPTPKKPRDNFIRYQLRHVILRLHKWHNKYWLLEISK